MTKVTNKSESTVNVAGTDVRPGATIEVDATRFKNWAMGNGAKRWIESGVIEADTKVNTSRKVKDDERGAVMTASTVGLSQERLALQNTASGLGIDFDTTTTDEELSNAISEQQESNSTNERDALLQEARNLGLNPNANTGDEKLRKMIADKKGQTA